MLFIFVIKEILALNYILKVALKPEIIFCSQYFLKRDKMRLGRVSVPQCVYVLMILSCRYCYECVNKFSDSSQRHCLVCGGTEGRTLVHCSVCPRAYHTTCITPNLSKVRVLWPVVKLVRGGWLGFISTDFWLESLLASFACFYNGEKKFLQNVNWHWVWYSNKYFS